MNMFQSAPQHRRVPVANIVWVWLSHDSNIILPSFEQLFVPKHVHIDRLLINIEDGDPAAHDLDAQAQPVSVNCSLQPRN